MKTTIKWLDKVSFSGVSESGHTIQIDGPPEEGGQNTGARPMELMLLGIGVCASFEVVSILKKSRQEITDCKASVSAIRTDTEPKVFTDIHIQFEVIGHKLNVQKVKRAIELSAEKYCSASLLMQRAGVNVTHSFTTGESESSA